jgi:excisionase family DNA binding protein
MKAIRGKKLTSKEAARVLGVSEASVKRWADSGRLPTEKTAGGHRRFRPEDIAFMRRATHADEAAAVEEQAKRFVTKRASRPPRLAASRVSSLVEETFGALIGGRDEELAALLVNLHLDGQSVGSIADRFVCAAMRRVGDLWHAGELSVAQEHVATRTATRALRSLETATGRSAGPLALASSVEEDYHALPLRLAALTLEARGFEAFNLGVNTPFSALAEALEMFRPRLVCVSATVLVGIDRAAREYAEFSRTARRHGASVVLGGAGFAHAGMRRRFPADLHAGSFRQLEEFAADLDTSAA